MSPASTFNEDAMNTADSIPWTDIARIANLAEAGFLADELSGLGMEARIQQVDDFNAASDRWSAKYLIQVPAEHAANAAEHLRQYLFEEDPAPRAILDAFRIPAGRGTNELISWRVMLLAALAGVVGFAYGQQFAPQKSPKRVQPDGLLAAADAIGRAFITEPVANQPQYRLSFDRRGKEWTLSADRDHDGVFEQTQRFPAVAATR
jgi:hypothetical protein